LVGFLGFPSGVVGSAVLRKTAWNSRPAEASKTKSTAQLLHGIITGESNLEYHMQSRPQLVPDLPLIIRGIDNFSASYELLISVRKRQRKTIQIKGSNNIQRVDMIYVPGLK